MKDVIMGVRESLVDKVEYLCKVFNSSNKTQKVCDAVAVYYQQIKAIVEEDAEVYVEYPNGDRERYFMGPDELEDR